MVGCKPKAGAKCSGGAACADEHTELACVDGKYSIGQQGDPCIGTASSCSVDGRSVLECQGGHLAKTRDCNGPAGCSFTNGFACDDGTKQPRR